MSLQPLDTTTDKGNTLLSPVAYDDDAVSLHSRSDRDTDSEDDELLAAARNSRELRARDRLVLLEEEEMDRLVADTRAQRERQRRESNLQRRGSNLALPNPMHILRNYSQTASGSAIEDDTSSAKNPRDEKRSKRRARRQQKRDRLLKEARDGEDGQLMYEMEGGGMKDGSSTGDSSDREDSDELDRRRLIQVSDAKTAKKRKWRKWIFIHITILVGFAFLVLLAGKLSLNKKRTSSAQLFSNGTALFAPTTLILSLDGFRADFLDRGLTPRLDAFVKEGISPLYMTPSFPSVTFPNHYTLATGLYPESHGVVGNTFWDPALKSEFYYIDPERSMDPKWWGGEPFWVTAEEQGVRTAVHMWPGSEAHIKGIEPSFLDAFDGNEKLPNKAERILEFLDKPGLEDPDADLEEMRPQIIAAYVPNVDAIGHRYGPNSTEIRSTISDVDTMLDQIFHGFEERNLTNIVNVIIVSDHGMATTDVSRMIQLEDLVDVDKIEHLDGWPLVGIRPKNPEDLQELYEQAFEKGKSNPNFEVYLKDKDMPGRYHFSNNDRIAPLWIIPKTGWAIVPRDEFDIPDAKAKNLKYHPRGLHGYDHEHPLMRAIFVARGPAFPHQPHSKVETFQNINVYNILCDSIGLEPMANNGTLRLPLRPVGLHDPDATLEGAEDSAPTASAGTESAEDGEGEEEGMMSILPITASIEFPEAPVASVGVDPIDAEPERPAAPETTSPEQEQAHEGGDDDQGEKASGGGSWWQNTIDWVNDKLDSFIDKISGGSKGS
ncbi:ectonucleotide pyrophosphatase/phosphodiesterase family member 1 [Xylariomycetidae sp. FL2044]|nr:ectonucleotide pyrophosphatase/phosphodiesterase family member 1 [Xylariomycetidae sp. FL2044]KAH9883422.1 ectonucleotide pyrophosphatase/phosphodiesterase family member 1 [Xylariomycetidae sp. FL2044]KAH9884148.1 ectonucleotide pyrophosphatase/phosphodiesterase family member 1 [Xylariomycetidae sp. FL2044]